MEVLEDSSTTKILIASYYCSLQKLIGSQHCSMQAICIDD